MELADRLREASARLIWTAQGAGSAVVAAVLDGLARHGGYPVHGTPWLPHEPPYDADAAAAASVENFKQNNRVT